MHLGRTWVAFRWTVFSWASCGESAMLITKWCCIEMAFYCMLVHATIQQNWPYICGGLIFAFSFFLFFRLARQLWIEPYENTLSRECNKVVSEFLLFCRRCHFVLKFLLVLVVLKHLISFIETELPWSHTWTINIEFCDFTCFFKINK